MEGVRTRRRHLEFVQYKKDTLATLSVVLSLEKTYQCRALQLVKHYFTLGVVCT